jgi:hypothetical protein
MTSAGESYKITWDELESRAHVALEDQVETQDVSQNEPVVPPEELDRQKALGIVGDFHLRR